jgi:uncharacterized protein (DUF433 family)
MPQINGIIVKDPDILGAVPVFRGTRVPLQALLDYLEGGETLDNFLMTFQPLLGMRLSPHWNWANRW